MSEFSNHSSRPLERFSSTSDYEKPDLCEICRKIDFKNYLIQQDKSPLEDDPGIHLGYLDDLIQRSSACSICTLIFDSAKRLLSGAAPPVNFEGERVSVSAHRGFYCKVNDEDSLNEMETYIEVYRLFLDFEPNIFHSSSQIRFQISTEYHEKAGFGRRVDSVIDINQVKRWLKICQDKHGDQCHAPVWLGEQQQPEFLRVIDVEKKCVISAPPECRYLALSYVWGDRQEMKSRLWLSTRANLSSFEEQGGIDVNALPRTISDAIEMVSKLGERYLWIDALCIVQDDDAELAEQTARMDLIYAKALLTIIAAAGSNADAGLPGLHAGTRATVQGSVRIDECYSLVQTVSQGDTSHIQNSTWHSRGWTFQERLLSRRVLIFTPDQVFWNCDLGTYCEETTLEIDDSMFFILKQALDCHSEFDDSVERFSLQSLKSYITQYSARKFTYESDALAAFSGILRRLEYTTKEIYHWGLPQTRFDQALCWKFGSERRETSCRVQAEDGSVLQIPFPSWSWLGWVGFISGARYNPHVHARTLDGSTKSELKFYKLGFHSNIKLIEDPSPMSTLPDMVNIKQMEQRSFAKDFPLRTKWKFDTEIKSHTSDPTIPFYDTGKIIFWTSHARIEARIAPISWMDESRPHLYHSGICITIKDKEIDIPISGRQVWRYFERQIGEDKMEEEELSENIWLDFIVISRRAESGEVETGRLNLLIVEWDEEEDGERRVARRLGTTIIEEGDWVEAERNWELIVLG